MLGWKAKDKDDLKKVMKTHFEKAAATSDPIGQHPAM
jgi:hypothetical protein